MIKKNSTRYGGWMKDGVRMESRIERETRSKFIDICQSQFDLSASRVIAKLIDWFLSNPIKNLRTIYDGKTDKKV